MIFKRLSVVLLLFYITVACVLVAEEKADTSYQIRGLVINSLDRSPVLRCIVTANLVGGGRGGPREPEITETDEQGRFSMNLPVPGNWELRASAHNIRSQPLDGHDGYFTGVILTQKSPTYDVVFEAVPDAQLTGTVIDESGEAVRGAQTTLFWLDPAAHEAGGTPLRQRQTVQTDDLGHFTMEAIDPGRYLVLVQARPWYANTGRGQPRNQPSTQELDSSLDLVYAATWFPGVTDASSAGVLNAHPGDALRADFRLIPQPSAHLLIPSSDFRQPQGNRPRETDGPGPPRPPVVSLLLADGSLQPVFGPVTSTAGGELDMSGLVPGTYQISVPGAGPGLPSRTSTVRIQSGSSTGFSAASPESSVTIAVDGGTTVNASQIVLTDTLSGRSFSSMERLGGRPSGQNQRPDSPVQQGGQGTIRGRRTGGPLSGGFATRGRSRPGNDDEEVTVQVPPGQYRVAVRNDGAAFVTGIVASKGAMAMGRLVTIPEAATHLTIHLSSGFATVSGNASLSGKAAVGALVLLVPATLGERGSLTITRRDQSNSDGSFRFEDVIPGQYILLAIDHGWSVDWTNSVVLEPYLVHGSPLDLTASAAVNLKLTAQVP